MDELTTTLTTAGYEYNKRSGSWRKAIPAELFRQPGRRYTEILVTAKGVYTTGRSGMVRIFNNVNDAIAHLEAQNG